MLRIYSFHIYYHNDKLFFDQQFQINSQKSCSNSYSRTRWMSNFISSFLYATHDDRLLPIFKTFLYFVVIVLQILNYLFVTVITSLKTQF